MGTVSDLHTDEEERASHLLQGCPSDDAEDQGHGEVECHPATTSRGCHDLDDPVVWKWIIVVGMFQVTFLQGGIDRVLSIYYVELIEYFEVDSSVTSLLGSIYFSFMCFSGIITLPLSERFGPRLIIMLGGVFIFTGFVTAAFAPNVYVCVATFGFFVGSGCSMSYMNACTVIMFYFDRRRALAQAIGLSGLGVGGFVLPIVVQHLNEKYTWKGGLGIVGAIMLNVCVSGALVRPIKTINRRSQDPSPKKRTSKDKSLGIRDSLKKLCSRAFIFICFQSLFVQGCLAMIAMHMKAIAVEKTGASDELGSYIASFYGAALFVGLLSSGLEAHLLNIEPIILAEINYFFCACGIIFIPLCKSFAAVACCISIFAHFTAPNATLLPLALHDLVGEDSIRIAWAVRFACAGVGGLVGPAIAGVLYDYTKEYYYSLYLLGGGLFLSVVLMIEPCISVVKAKRKAGGKRKTKGEIEEVWRSITSLPGSGLQ